MSQLTSLISLILLSSFACSLISDGTPGVPTSTRGPYSFLRMKCYRRQALSSKTCQRYFALLANSTTPSTIMARQNLTTTVTTVIPTAVLTVKLSSGVPAWLTTLISLFSVLASIYAAIVSYLKFACKYSTGSSLRLGFSPGRSGQLETEAPDLPIDLTPAA